MGATREGGVTVTESEYTEAVSDEMRDCFFQNPGAVMLYVVLSAEKPAPGFKAPIKVPPYAVWARNDTASTPAMQGKIWLKGRGDDFVVPITEDV